MDNLGQGGNGVEVEECPICLESLNKFLCLRTACEHSFHTHCLLGWIGRNRDKDGKRCPMCKALLEERYTLYTYVDQNGTTGKQERCSLSTGSKLTEDGGATGEQAVTPGGHGRNMEKRMRDLEDSVRRVELRAENAEKRAERAEQTVREAMPWHAVQRNLFMPGNLMRRERELDHGNYEQVLKLREIRDELLARLAHFSRLRAGYFTNPADFGKYGTPQECMEWLENINRF